ncbi:hypothetical protein [Devosia chinhatensis]|uniref:Glycosyltransferase RgtA/B/C/D-like domain-containing protein n=1 Tax=Devosia chinhatensis TaxID=429727 RepID=A0A0F5FIJ7_9HYPH|nr:hypothetical protein [Devosia chinhatensis]KKB08022.1 hypothetical protein VE26_15660 [Devosia chinhatensis]
MVGPALLKVVTMPQRETSLHGRDWLLLLVVWAMAAGGLLLRALSGGADVPFFADTDDAMRMVVVSDFLGGQAWYDHLQYRLDTPFGTQIHWSRWVDLPLAGLVLLSEPFAGRQGALQFAGTVWPFLLLGLALYLTGRTGLALLGRPGLLPALVLPLLAPAFLAEFAPGRVDHHNVVIVLVMAGLLASLLSLRRSFWSWIAGLVAATALAIAVESLPGVLAVIVAFGLSYAFAAEARGNLGRFGLAFALGLVLHLALAQPPASWLAPACDGLSVVYVLAGVIVGGGYVALSRLPAPRHVWQRFALLAGLAGLAVIVVITAFPLCLGGPYADLDPWLRDHWIAGIVEAKSWPEALKDVPAFAMGAAVPVLVGLAGALLALRQERGRRLEWLILLVFILTTACIMLAQVRGARLAILPAIPGAAWLILFARRAYLERPRLSGALGVIGAWLSASGLVVMLATAIVVSLFPQERAQRVSEALSGRRACLAGSAFADLRALPPERIMAPIDLGGHILLETPHAVVAAPYHRNERGILDTFRFFNGPADAARDIARQRGLGLVVTCQAMPEMRGEGLGVEGTLLTMMAADALPDWIVKVPGPGPLDLYAILP